MARTLCELVADIPLMSQEAIEQEAARLVAEEALGDDDAYLAGLGALEVDPSLLPPPSDPYLAALSAFNALLDGTLEPLAVARRIGPHYRALEAQADALAERVGELKRWLAACYERSGTDVISLSECDMEITQRAPWVKVTPDAKGVQAVIDRLTDAGHPLAIVLADTLKVTPVAATTVIGRPKKKRA